VILRRRVAESDQELVVHTAEERKATLDQTLEDWAVDGWRIENRSDFQATIAKGEPVNHLLHALVTFLTVVWIIPWMVMAMTGGVKRKMLSVDEYGDLLVLDVS